jgi:hypothetical protein
MADRWSFRSTEISKRESPNCGECCRTDFVGGKKEDRGKTALSSRADDPEADGDCEGACDFPGVAVFEAAVEGNGDGAVEGRAVVAAAPSAGATPSHFTASKLESVCIAVIFFGTLPVPLMPVGTALGKTQLLTVNGDSVSLINSVAAPTKMQSLTLIPAVSHMRTAWPSSTELLQKFDNWTDGVKSANKPPNDAQTPQRGVHMGIDISKSSI